VRTAAARRSSLGGRTTNRKTGSVEEVASFSFDPRTALTALAATPENGLPGADQGCALRLDAHADQAIEILCIVGRH
jgi:hypothetical protein